MEIAERVELYSKHFSYREREELPSKITVTEALMAQDSSLLIPRVIVGVMREAAEPLYIGSMFMPEIKLEQGVSLEFPSLGILSAHFVEEGGPYGEQTLDFQRHRQSTEVKVRKVGLRVQFTDEMVTDSQWDVMGYHLRAAGRAMARFKEEWLFREWTRHGHVVFDNALADANAHTTGLGMDGAPNNTLSLFDVIDACAAVMANGFTPTTLVMHPLAWVVFAKNNILGSMMQSSMTTGMKMASDTNSNPIQFGEEAVRNSLPLPFEYVLSPFVPLNRINRTYDMYVIDRNNIGATIVKETMNIEKFDEPARDIHNIKVREKYVPAIFNEGRAVAVIKNLSLAPSWPRPMLMRNI